MSETCLVLVALAIGLTCSAVAADGIVLTLHTDRPELVMGEPLLVELTALNATDEEVLIRTDGEAPNRFLIAGDGTRTPLIPPEPVGSSLYFYDKIPVGSNKTLRFLVPEIAEVKRPGEYRLLVEYEDLHASGELKFAVKPYNQGALRARTAELYRAVVTGAEYGFGPSAIMTIEPAIAKPFLCDLMKLTRSTAAPVYRLEQIGDEESIQCLIGAFPTAKGDLRDILTGALLRLLKDLPDGPSKENIKRALGQPL